MASSVTVMTSQEALDAILSDTLPRQGRWSDEDYLWLTDRTRPSTWRPRSTHANSALLSS